MNRQYPILTASLIVGLTAWQGYLGGWSGQPEGRVLIEYGARKVNAGFPQAPWRLFASLLLHANWSHLVSNIFVLAIWGGRLEGLLGRLPMLGLLALAGVWGNLLSDIYGPELLGMGISGSALALVSCTLVLAALIPQAEGWGGEASRWLFLSCAALALALAVGLVAGSGGAHRLDHWGHFGGTVCGAIVGLAAGKAEPRRALATAAVVTLGAISAAVVVWYRGSSPFG